MSTFLRILLHVIWMQTAFTQECGFGQITTTVDSTDPNGYRCVYICMDDYFTNGFDTTNLPTYDLNTRSFSEIKGACPHIQLSIDYYPSTPCSFDDLVWPTCGCPYCPCQQATTEYHETQFYFKKECATCTCGLVNQNGDYGMVCSIDDDTSVSNAADWNHFSCSEEITCSSLNPNDLYSEYSPGETWWESIAYDDSCQTFCICEHDGTPYCETSYADIVASTHRGLRYAFFNNKCYGVEGCGNPQESSLLVRSQSSYCTCPECRCSSGKQVGDKEFVAYTESGSDSFNIQPMFSDSDSTYCMECSCTYGSTSAPVRSCDQYGDSTNEYTPGTDTCPSAVVATCLSGSSNSTSATDAGLSSSDCYGSKGYCGWHYQYMSDSQGNQIGEMGDPSWGCQDSWVCDAFQVSDGNCIDLELDFGAVYTAMAGCDSDVNAAMMASVYADVNMHMYQMCCTGSGCNNEDIDISRCSASTEGSNWYNTYIQCLMGPESQYLQWMCESTDVGATCDDLQTMGTWMFGCDCTAYSYLYTRINAEGKAFFAAELDLKLKALDEWIELYGCTLSFSCDLSSGQLTHQTAPTTAAPTGATPSPTRPSQAPTDATLTPTGVTSSPTEPTVNPSQVPTGASQTPTTAQPTEETDAPTLSPTADTASPTEATSSPTEDTSAPTEATADPTAVTSSPTQGTLSPTAAPICDAAFECDTATCETKCVEEDGCQICAPLGSLANKYNIAGAVWIGFVVYAMQ